MEDLSNTKKISLLEKISSFENLLIAFKDCSRGKRRKAGYQKFLFNYGEKLKGIEQEIKSTNNFKWGGYREFYAYDPKKRMVMAAPFRDRIVHTALHLISSPIIEPTLGCRTFACRIGMGNRQASIRLQKQLKMMGKNRYCVKLDVRKYFASIDHTILFDNIIKMFPDDSLNEIFLSLIQSHPEYSKIGKGIPIGNLTSQLFANFYLSSMDKLGCDLLDIDFFEDKFENHACYIRYMDDMVIIATTKEKALDTATQLVTHARENLRLNIPDSKYVVLSNDPVPFLGYVLDDNGYRVLRRNERKFVKKIKRLKKKGFSLAYRAQVLQSYEAWQKIDLKV